MTSRIDTASETWRRVAAHCEAAIAEALLTLETPGVDHARSEGLRGRIAALREVLALPAPPEQPEVTPPVNYS